MRKDCRYNKIGIEVRRHMELLVESKKELKYQPRSFFYSIAFNLFTT